MKGKQITNTNAMLSSDAEYLGALLDSSQGVVFFTSGKLEKATLKVDFKFKNFIFKGGTEIVFYEDGSVSEGTFKEDTVISNLTFLGGYRVKLYPTGQVRKGLVKAGGRPNDLNLELFVDTYVWFNPDGYAMKFKRYPQYEEYKVLGISCIYETYVIYNIKEGMYKLKEGTTSKPQLVAMLTKSVNNHGYPTSVEPIIVPADTLFYFNKQRYANVAPPSDPDTWKIRQPFSINGYNFPKNSTLFISDMKLHGVQVYKKTTIDGYEFEAWDIVTFSNIGKIYKP